MKCLIIAAIIPLCVSCQNVDNRHAEELKKYTYYIVGFRHESSVKYFRNGSGYFIKDNNQLFFVTAQHVLNGCEFVDTCKPIVKTPYPDTMQIYLTTEGKFNGRKITIDIRKIKDTSVCASIPYTPDLIAYKIDDPIPDTVYTINDFLPFTLPKKKSEIDIYGFPYLANIDKEGYYMESPASHLSFNKYEFYNYYPYKINACNVSKTIIDSMNYVVKTTNISYDSLRGYSGSPVFIRNRKNNKWAFIGTFVAKVEYDKYAITKPEYTLNILKH